MTEVYAAHGMPSGNPQYLEADLTTTGMQGTGDFVTTTDFDCRVSELTVDATYNDQEGVRREVSASALAGNYVQGMFDGVPGSASIYSFVKFAVSYQGPNSHVTMTLPK